MKITWGLVSSPFGWCVIGFTEHYLCHLSFLDKRDGKEARKHIRAAWPAAVLARDDGSVESQSKKVFGAGREKQSIPLVLIGTPFQKKVWHALQAIPAGRTASYTDIAFAVGSPRATRAVGAACGKNPIGFVIPCHRVVASDGTLGGYH
jgi:AraC family transcriptional regulator, regulatory protein of adaptative response / methylated-DNA-[protein]-cysteine methyltransferase